MKHFKIRVRAAKQRIRYWLVSKLLTKYEKERILNLIEEAESIVIINDSEKYYQLRRGRKSLEIDIFKQELKNVW